jgi:catalase-peroxidase
MNDMMPDKTFTKTFELPGKCPFGGDRIGGTFGKPPTLENWYPDRLRVELLHQNGLAALIQRMSGIRWRMSHK